MPQTLFNLGPLQKVKLDFTAGTVPLPLQSQSSPAPEVPDFAFTQAPWAGSTQSHRLPPPRTQKISWSRLDLYICFVLQSLDQETEGFCFHQTGSLVDLRPALGLSHSSQHCMRRLEKGILLHLSWLPIPCVSTWVKNSDISDAHNGTGCVQNLSACSGSRSLKSFSALHRLCFHPSGGQGYNFASFFSLLKWFNNIYMLFIPWAKQKWQDEGTHPCAHTAITCFELLFPSALHQTHAFGMWFIMSRGVHHFWHRATRLIKSWTHTSTIDGNVKCDLIEKGIKPFKISFLKVVLHVAKAPHNYWGFISICLWEKGHGIV